MKRGDWRMNCSYSSVTLVTDDSILEYQVLKSASCCPCRYMCYCGKLQDPPADPWLAPHSCGSVCQRELKPTCGHTCLLLCHPGTHTRINTQTHQWGCLVRSLTTRTCAFQAPVLRVQRWFQSPVCVAKLSPSLVAVATRYRCKEKRPNLTVFLASVFIAFHIFFQAWSCQQKCGRLLPCGQHSCTQPCHTGAHVTSHFLFCRCVFVLHSFLSVTYLSSLCVCVCQCVLPVPGSAFRSVCVAVRRWSVRVPALVGTVSRYSEHVTDLLLLLEKQANTHSFKHTQTWK